MCRGVASRGDKEKDNITQLAENAELSARNIVNIAEIIWEGE